MGKEDKRNQHPREIHVDREDASSSAGAPKVSSYDMYALTCRISEVVRPS